MGDDVCGQVADIVDGPAVCVVPVDYGVEGGIAMRPGLGGNGDMDAGGPGVDEGHRFVAAAGGEDVHDLLNRSVQASDGDERGFRALLGRAEAVARDPKLDEAHRARLESAVDGARKRADSLRRYNRLRREWDAFRTPIEARGLPVFAKRNCRPYVERAREISRDPHLRADVKDRIAKFLREHDISRPAAVKRYGQLFKTWNDVRARAKSQGVGRFAMPESAEIVEEMRRLSVSPHLTPRQKGTFANIAAERDRHFALQQERQQRRQRQLSQRLTRGRTM